MADRFPEKTAVLLLAHGTPETLDDIPAYLRNVVSGRPMPDHVVEEIRHRYALIGKSPLTEITMLQGQLLAEKIGLPVYIGMRNWKPYIADVVKQMRADGITSAAAICLAPQNSRTSVGLYRRAAFAEAGDAIQIEFVESWADHPLLAKAFADKLIPLRKQLSEETGVGSPSTLHRPQRPMPNDPNARTPGCGRNPRRARENLLAGRGPGDSRSLSGRRQEHGTPRRRAGRSRRLAMVLRLPKPGAIRRPVDRPHR